MIVLDASAAIEFVLGTPVGHSVRNRIASGDMSLHAPHLIDPEVAQVMRRKVARREFSAHRAKEALDDFADLRMRRYPHGPLLERAWELRERLTAYDAMYVVLAEALDAPLVTTDRRLSRVSAHVEVLSDRG